jgi:hypothetical protein
VEPLVALCLIAANLGIPLSVWVVARAFQTLQTVGGQPVELLKQQQELQATLQRESTETQRLYMEQRLKAREGVLSS